MTRSDPVSANCLVVFSESDNGWSVGADDMVPCGTELWTVTIGFLGGRRCWCAGFRVVGKKVDGQKSYTSCLAMRR